MNKLNSIICPIFWNLVQKIQKLFGHLKLNHFCHIVCYIINYLIKFMSSTININWTGFNIKLSIILLCTPLYIPFILLAPSYPWPRCLKMERRFRSMFCTIFQTMQHQIGPQLYRNKQKYELIYTTFGLPFSSHSMEQERYISHSWPALEMSPKKIIIIQWKQMELLNVTIQFSLMYFCCCIYWFTYLYFLKEDESVLFGL